MTAIEFNNRFEELRPMMFAFAIKLTRNTEDANDLMQETSFRAFRSLEQFKDGTHFKSWISTILRNNFINEYRKRRTRNKVEAPINEVMNKLVSMETGISNPQSSVLMGELKNMISTLADGYRIPFLMHYEGYAYDEIATELDLKMGTVKSRIFYARKKIKSQIKANYGEARLHAA
ncbi:MAG: RNA polymerase sigma factor (sigma-70 family) [Paraglaciecola sp.]|jgi:RNA polymerase sigma factor (sigma-70 family)